MLISAPALSAMQLGCMFQAPYQTLLICSQPRALTGTVAYSTTRVGVVLVVHCCYVCKHELDELESSCACTGRRPINRVEIYSVSSPSLDPSTSLESILVRAL